MYCGQIEVGVSGSPGNISVVIPITIGTVPLRKNILKGAASNARAKDLGEFHYNKNIYNIYHST